MTASLMKQIGPIPKKQQARCFEGMGAHLRGVHLRIA